MSLLLTGDTASGSTRTLLTDQNGILQVAINSAGDTASSTQISNTSANPVPVALVGDTLSSVTVSGTVSVSNFPSSTEIANDVGNPIPVSGTVTVNAGTNLNTSALALESGGNLTTIATKETAIAAAAGTTADTAWTSGTGTLVALGKATVNAINASLPAGSNTIGSVNVLGGNTTAVKVDGSATTQPVSGTVTANVQGGNSTAVKVDGSAVTQPVSGTVSVSGTVPVTGTFYQATQPVSGTVTANVQGGNSTAVKVDGSAVTQPVSGTVTVSNPQTSVSITGTPTVSVQGGNATAVKVDGSAVTQPVSGTVTVNAGTNLNTSALALESGGNLTTIATKETAIAAAAGTTADTAWTSGTGTLVALGKATVNAINASLPAGSNTIGSVNVLGGNTTAVKVDGSATTQPVSGTVSVSGTVPVSGTFYQATQPVSGTVTANVQGGNSTAVKVDGSAVTQPVSGTVSVSGTVPVSGTFYQATQPVSGTVTANVQGGNSTAVKVDGSAVTQPVSLAAVPSHAVTNAGTFAVQPSAGDLTSGSQTTKIVNGANTLAVDSVGAVTANNQSLSSVSTFTQGSGAISANQVLIGPITCSQYRDVGIHFVTNGASIQIQAQVSNDNTNWAATSMSTSSGLYAAQAQSGGVGFWQTPTFGAQFWRLISTGAGSGAVTVNASFSQQIQPRAIQQIGVSSVSLGSSGATIGATLMPAGAITMTNSSVGTTSATLLAASSATKLLVVQNTHATQSIYVSTATPATATNGILIPPTWGYEFPYIPTNALYCLGSGASTTYTLWYA